MQRKLFLSLMLLSLVGIITISLMINRVVTTNYQAQVGETLTFYAQTLREVIASNQTSVEDYDQFAIDLAKDIGARITFVASDGVVLGDSDADIKNLDNHAEREEIQEALRGHYGYAIRYSDTLKTNMYYVAIPSDDDQLIAVIRVALPLTQIKNYHSDLFKQMSWAVFITFVLSALMAYVLSKQITKPLIQLASVTSEIAKGDFGKKVYVESKDEIGQLASQFNQMSYALKQYMTDFNDRNQKLRSILNSMINAVVVVDRQQCILFVNPEAEALFGFQEADVIGRHLLEAIQSAALDIQVTSIFDFNEPMVTEIVIERPDRHILMVYSNPIQTSDTDHEAYGVVMLFQDITEMRKLEVMRKDFVANVSHELKTPLTSIKGFIETLKEGAVDNPKVRDRFLDIIDIETERLSAIIQDLLLLSDIENERMPSNDTVFDAVHLTEDVKEFLTDLAIRNQVTIRFKKNTDTCLLYGNPNWFKQLLINLIDNAIKYNKEDGHVIVSIDLKHRHLELRIEDTGVGMEEGHIDRIFERFYRVDKARTRTVGGTGLGLAIVKHIVIAFKGTIHVDSKAGQGTRFTMVFPLQKQP